MKKKILVILKKAQFDSLNCTKIIRTLKKAQLITDKDQLDFRTLDVSMNGLANLTTVSETAHVCHVGLKLETTENLIKKIDLTNGKRSVHHIVLCPDGPTSSIAGFKNVSVYQTHEELEREDFSKVFEMREETAMAG